ncbi:unnamed protein product [Urochloa humidicola]
MLLRSYQPNPPRPRRSPNQIKLSSAPLMAPDPIAGPSPAARSSLSASAPPFYPAADRHRDIPSEGSPSGQQEPSNRNVQLLPGSSHGVPAAPSVQAVQSQKRNHTHFISLQLAIRSGHDDKLSSFQKPIVGDEAKRCFWEHFGIDKSLLAKPETFHLTVLMLELKDEDRVDMASRVLKSLSTQVNNALGNKPIFIQLRGLECMKGSQAKAQVVYAPVLEVGGEGRLARACKVIIDAFVNSGLALQNDVRELKLHVTIMNVRFRASKKPNDSFDARNIFEQYGKEEWEMQAE